MLLNLTFQGSVKYVLGGNTMWSVLLLRWGVQRTSRYFFKLVWIFSHRWFHGHLWNWKTVCKWGVTFWMKLNPTPVFSSLSGSIMFGLGCLVLVASILRFKVFPLLYSLKTRRFGWLAPSPTILERCHFTVCTSESLKAVVKLSGRRMAPLPMIMENIINCW